jgi:thiosulfate dehydrogenase [quinone] large subunit
MWRATTVDQNGIEDFMTHMTATTGLATPIVGAKVKAAVTESTIVTTAAGRRTLAVLRFATGFIFLWAFLDKTFGLGFSTVTKSAWINGGAPSQGFLNSPAVVGPLKPFFAAIASPTSDILFMLGMIAVGAAVMLGIGLRVSAVAGSIILVFMYLAEWPFAANAGSTNPLVDYHIIYALALVAIAVLSAGDTWGLGRAWKSVPFVRAHTWLI